MNKKTNLTIFASGSGSNTENIAKHFEQHSQIQVTGIFSNRPDAFVHERAKKLNIPSQTFTKEDFLSPSFLEHLGATDYIILAGFLWLIPKYLVAAFPNRIINIHPSLLPSFGGKGMYGAHVHKAVIAAGENESGITIHLVNEEYDKGKILHQARCKVGENDKFDDLAQKIHSLEQDHFPKVIEEYIIS